jgi:hypothetical protein
MTQSTRLSEWPLSAAEAPTQFDVFRGLSRATSTTSTLSRHCVKRPNKFFRLTCWSAHCWKIRGSNASSCGHEVAVEVGRIIEEN